MSSALQTTTYAFAVALWSCGSSPLAAADSSATCKVRGQVVQVSGAGGDLRVTIAHEVIRSFKDREGRAKDMPAMTMAFGLAAGLNADRFLAGSKWELIVDVTWDREPTLLITSATRLPPATELVLASSARGH